LHCRKPEYALCRIEICTEMSLTLQANDDRKDSPPELTLFVVVGLLTDAGAHTPNAVNSMWCVFFKLLSNLPKSH